MIQPEDICFRDEESLRASIKVLDEYYWFSSEPLESNIEFKDASSVRHELASMQPLARNSEIKTTRPESRKEFIASRPWLSYLSEDGQRLAYESFLREGNVKLTSEDSAGCSGDSDVW
jgi:hypothetical protein